MVSVLLIDGVSGKTFDLMRRTPVVLSNSSGILKIGSDALCNMPILKY